MDKTYTKFDLLKIYILNDLKDFNLKRIFHFLFIFIKNKLGLGPFNLLVETSNLCNLNCETCPTPRKLINRPTIPMSLETFKKIIDNSKNYVYRVVLHWTNEPLTNKNINLFIKYCKENNLFTSFSTNVILLNNETSKKLLNAGLNHIELCLDGMSKNSFKNFRNSDSFEIAINNIKNFIKLRNKLKAKTFIEIQVIANKFNQDEIEKIKKFVKEIGADKLFIKTFGLSGNFHSKKEREKLLKKFLPTKKGITRRYDEKNAPIIKMNSCDFIKNVISVTVDGQVTPCCEDFQSFYYLGNLKDTKLPDLLNSKKAKKIINLASSRKLPICKHCVPVI